MAASLSEQVYEKLFDMIVQKELKPGDRLPPEKTLCEMYSVSRNTLRAALNKLCALGFTETRQGGGTFVRAVDSNVYLNFFVPALLTHNPDLLELMQLRKAIEMEAARSAAVNASEEDVKKLRTVFEECGRLAAETDMYALAAANTRFHAVVSEISGSRMLETLMRIINRMILPEMQDYLARQGEDIDSNYYHRVIMESIERHKPDEAAFFMEKHLALLIDRVKQYISADKERKE